MGRETTVISIDEICRDNYIIRFANAEIAAKAKPGQFVNVLCPGDSGLVLRRPFSIMDADGRKGTFDIAFEVRGKGTALLAKCRPGDLLDIMGPLGNGFTIEDSQKKIAIVGGGIGIYPLYFLAKTHPASEKHVFTGCLCSEKAVFGDRFERSGCGLYISTDDGSLGYCGYVTDLFKQEYTPGKYDMTFICGPGAMAEKTVRLVREAGGRCQVSLEERMGCGIGACLVCTCEIMEEGGTKRKTVCKDGPVFNEKQVFPEV